MYGADVAYVHTAGFGLFSLRAGKWILKTLAQRGIRNGTVVDLGCGGGEWLRMLCDAGYEVVGLDASPACVRTARRVAPRAKVQRGSIWEYELPSCQAVTSLGEVLSYLEPGVSRAPSLKRLFSRVHDALPKNGLFFFDMLTGFAGQAVNYRSWTAGEDWAVLVEVTEHKRKARVVRDLTTFRKVGGGKFKRASERHVLRVLSRSTIAKSLREVGFAVQTFSAYGDLAMLPGRTAFRARRR